VGEKYGKVVGIRPDDNQSRPDRVFFSFSRSFYGGGGGGEGGEGIYVRDIPE
jgi:hypothetical protein